MRSEDIENVHEIKSEIFKDKRGAFLSCFKENEKLFNKVWVDKKICQINRTLTRKKGAVRGLHFQKPPHAETKIVSCLKGKVWDVVVDLREGSSTFLSYHAVVLSADNHKSYLIYNFSFWNS